MKPEEIADLRDWAAAFPDSPKMQLVLRLIAKYEQTVGVLEWTESEWREQKRVNIALAERCAGQKQLLEKRAEKPE